MSWRDGVGIELVQPLDRGHALARSRRCGPAGSSRSTPRGPSAPCRASTSPGDAGRPGASASSALSSVVLPTPLRPTSTIFSPRLTIALEVRRRPRAPPYALVTSLNSSASRPDGRVHRELDVRALDVRPRQLGRLQPLDFLAARLHLARARAGGEARDEVVQLRDLLLALRVLRLRSASGSASWRAPCRRSRRCR